MRLFIGLSLPQEIKDYLEILQGQFSSLNFTKKNNLHLTLKFIGEGDTNEIISKLEKIEFEPFKLTLDKIGYFSSEKNIRVVWVGLKDISKLTQLHKKIEEALGSPAEDFKGHITIARVGRFQNISKKIVEVEPKEFTINSFDLFNSNLTSNGPEYEIVRSFKLSPKI